MAVSSSYHVFDRRWKPYAESLSQKTWQCANFLLQKRWQRVSSRPPIMDLLYGGSNVLSLFCKRDGSVLGLFCKRDGSNVQAPSISVSLMCCLESRLTLSRVAATCRRSKFLDLFGKRALFSKGSFAKKTPQFREPASRVAPTHTHPRRHTTYLYIYMHIHLCPHVCGLTCVRAAVSFAKES